jgi:hypothetical protein
MSPGPDDWDRYTRNQWREAKAADPSVVEALQRAIREREGRGPARAPEAPSAPPLTSPGGPSKEADTLGPIQLPADVLLDSGSWASSKKKRRRVWPRWAR